MRALGAVLADLADLGYDAAWHGLRAADVGAPHGRFRVFIVAWPAANTDRNGFQGIGRIGAVGRDADRLGGPGQEAAGPALLRTPTAQLAINGGSQHPDKRRLGGHGPTLADEVEHLLPTPAVNDMGRAYTPEQWDQWTDRMKAAHGNGNGHGKSLEIEAQRLLPTPRATDGTKGGPNQRGTSGDLMLPSAATRLLPTPRTENNENRQSERFDPNQTTNFHGLLNGRHSWGDYGDAIARWEHLTRPAPSPTEPTGKNGAHRLSPRFVEWMMGLPDGWVTDADLGLTRNQQLKALGNGVVPQQAAAGLVWLLNATRAVGA